jgi:hypothetical protein
MDSTTELIHIITLHEDLLLKLLSFFNCVEIANIVKHGSWFYKILIINNITHIINNKANFYKREREILWNIYYKHAADKKNKIQTLMNMSFILLSSSSDIYNNEWFDIYRPQFCYCVDNTKLFFDCDEENVVFEIKIKVGILIKFYNVSIYYALQIIGELLAHQIEYFLKIKKETTLTDKQIYDIVFNEIEYQSDQYHKIIRLMSEYDFPFDDALDFYNIYRGDEAFNNFIIRYERLLAIANDTFG